MKDQNKCFEIKIKLECSHIRLTSEEKQSIKPCKKSPSQLKRDKERKQKFVDIKSKEEAPTTEMNAGKPSATEKAERNLLLTAPPPGASPTHVSAWTGRMEERGGRQCVSRPKARESARGETVT